MLKWLLLMYGYFFDFNSPNLSWWYSNFTTGFPNKVCLKSKMFLVLMTKGGTIVLCQTR
jgi:hypothetical protein